MTQLKFSVLVLCLGLGFTASSQSAASNQPALKILSENIVNITAAEEDNSEEVYEESWSFFTNEDDQLFYIDFQALGGNLTSMVVLDENGNKVVEEDLLFFPDDTIYELDLFDFKEGTYHVLLETYSETIQTELIVSK